MSDGTDIAITYANRDGKGRFKARVEGVADHGELLTVEVSPSLIVAVHTVVPDSMQGKGVAAALVKALIADARDKGQRIVALCPFVRSYAQRKGEEVADVFQW